MGKEKRAGKVVAQEGVSEPVAQQGVDELAAAVSRRLRFHAAFGVRRVRLGTAAGRLAEVERQAKRCQLCDLARTRTNVVFGEGNPEARLVFVGEAPGQDEDLQGRPFVGRAGEMLNKIIEAERVLGMRRSDVYICNVLKCRPPGNRSPDPFEVARCLPYLFAQLEALQAEVICCLGAVAMQALLGTKEPIGRLRGRMLDFRGGKLIATYHPAYLVRNPGPEEKRKVWADMLQVREYLASLR
jgi:DNA polymerase